MTDLPEEFKKQMEAQLGADVSAFLQALHEPSPVSIRYNPQKLLPPGSEPVPWCTMGRYLPSRPSFTLDPLFHAGGYYVQEASSMLLEQGVRQTMDQGKPVVALDLCAAPGGKSTHLLSILPPESLLVSNEVIRGRVHILIENLEKWGHPNVIITQNDPADFDGLNGYFDLILVDAPCSGEGLFRKDAEALKEWSPRNVDLCASRQRRILADVWRSLRPGGVLIYSTCTYNTKENQENLAHLLKSHSGETVKLGLDPAWGVLEIVDNGVAGYQCLPHRVRGEGFFISVIRKSGNENPNFPRVKDPLRYPTKSDAGLVSSWVTHPTEKLFFQHGSQIRMLPILHKTHLQVLLERLHVLQAGTALGEIKKNKIVPEHALALSVCRNADQLEGINVSKEEALSYLRIDPLKLNQRESGFRVIEYEGLGLGWVNLLPGRTNNLFPTARRVRLTD